MVKYQLRLGSGSLAAGAAASFGRGGRDRLEIDRLKFLALDARTDLLRRHLALRHDVGVMLLFRAGGAFRAVGTLEAAVHAVVAHRPVAAAIAGELEEYGLNGRSFFINLDLPGITEIISRQLASGEDRRQLGSFGRWLRVVCGDIVGGIRPLGVSGNREGRDQETPGALNQQAFHNDSWSSVYGKPRGGES
jgi:hypothetical protein